MFFFLWGLIKTPKSRLATEALHPPAPFKAGRNAWSKWAFCRWSV